MDEIVTEKTNAQQRKAVEALLTFGTVTAAAEAAGVTRRTLYRWQQQPEFVAALKQAEQAALTELSRALAGLGVAAVDALRDALSKSEKMNHRLRASEIAIANLLRVRELIEIEERLQALEEAMHGKKSE